MRGSRGTYAAADEEEARPLDAEEWRQVLLALGWVDERADDGVVQREARRAQKLLREAKMAQPSARFEPAERQLADEWSYALVELRAVHVRGSFALWPRGLPPHRVCPPLSARMPAALFHAAASPGGGGANPNPNPNSHPNPNPNPDPDPDPDSDPKPNAAPLRARPAARSALIHFVFDY